MSICREGREAVARLIKRVRRNEPVTGVALHRTTTGKAVVDRACSHELTIPGLSG